MKGHTQPPIIILVDEITHTAEWPQCKDPSCPCHLEVEDEIADVPPTEAALDEQERRVSIGTRVLIEVEIRGFYEGLMMIAGGWMPLSRIKAICTPRPNPFDISRELAQIRNLTTQTDDGSWW